MKRYLLVNGVPRKVKDGLTREEAVATLTAKGYTCQLIDNPPSIEDTSEVVNRLCGQGNRWVQG